MTVCLLLKKQTNLSFICLKKDIIAIFHNKERKIIFNTNLTTTEFLKVTLEINVLVNPNTAIIHIIKMLFLTIHQPFQSNCS